MKYSKTLFKFLTTEVTPSNKLPFNNIYQNQIILLQLTNEKESILIELFNNGTMQKNKYFFDEYVDKFYFGDEVIFYNNFTNLKKWNEIQYYEMINAYKDDKWHLTDIYISNFDIKTN